MGTAVVINNTTTNIDIPLTRGPIFLAGWFICMYLELILPLNTRKTSASYTWTKTWDVFCDALVARFPNTSQVQVCGDDADVFILLFHHAHRLCDVIMELDVSSGNNWRCTNVHEPARKIGPQVSEMSRLYLLYCGSESTKGCWYQQLSPFLFQVCQVLVTYHAYTGCDYTILFSHNGENRHFELMMSEAD